MKGYLAWILFVLAVVNTLALYEQYSSGAFPGLNEVVFNGASPLAFLNSLVNWIVVSLCYWGWWKMKS